MTDDLSSADTLLIKTSSMELLNALHGTPSPFKLDHDAVHPALVPDIVDEPTRISTPLDTGVDGSPSSPLPTVAHAEVGAEDEFNSPSATSLNDQRESSPANGVIVPEEQRVTDRVKVFEAVANPEPSSTAKKDWLKNGNGKKSPASLSLTDQKQVSPSSTDSFDSQSINELKSSTGKGKSKRTSLKKQLQNLLKIDKSSTPDEPAIVEEPTNGKKSAAPKRDARKSNAKKSLTSRFLVS